MDAASEVANRRQKPRTQPAQAAIVQLTLPSYGGAPRVQVVKLVDVSSGGLGVESRVPLSLGVRVKFESTFSFAGRRLRASGDAVVVNVRQVDAAYRVGLSCQNIVWTDV